MYRYDLVWEAVRVASRSDEHGRDMAVCRMELFGNGAARGFKRGDMVGTAGASTIRLLVVIFLPAERRRLLKRAPSGGRTVASGHEAPACGLTVKSRRLSQKTLVRRQEKRPVL